MCSAVTVECCTHVAWVSLVCLLLCKEDGSSPVSLQLLKGGDMGLYEVPLLMLVQLHLIGSQAITG